MPNTEFKFGEIVFFPYEGRNFRGKFLWPFFASQLTQMIIFFVQNALGTGFDCDAYRSSLCYFLFFAFTGHTLPVMYLILSRGSAVPLAAGQADAPQASQALHVWRAPRPNPSPYSAPIPQRFGRPGDVWDEVGQTMALLFRLPAGEGYEIRSPEGTRPHSRAKRKPYFLSQRPVKFLHPMLSSRVQELGLAAPTVGGGATANKLFWKKHPQWPFPTISHIFFYI